jgi:DUF1680 family protein
VERRPAEFLLTPRVPSWSKSFGVGVGASAYARTPGEYPKLEGTWCEGHTVVITMELNDQWLDGERSYSHHCVVRPRPQVLALDATVNSAIKDMVG